MIPAVQPDPGAPDAGGAEPTLSLPPEAVPGATGAEPTVPLPAAGAPGFSAPSGYAAPPAPPAAPFASAPAGPVPAPTTAPRRRRALPILLVVVALVVVGGGVAAAGTFLGWFGSRTQPSALVPASAVAYVQVDLDPSLAQKTAAWQFLRDLPQVKDAVAAGNPDPKAIGWKLITQAEDTPFAEVNYETDVKPWLGDRLAVAAVPNGSQAAGLVVVQVSDEAKGKAGLEALLAKSEQSTDVTMRDGYGLITRSGDTSAVLAALDEGTLAKSETFSTDFASLGDPGVLAGWIDGAALVKLQPDLGVTSSGLPQGRAVGALGFTADTLSLTGRMIGLSGVGQGGRADLGTLPASTWAALGYSGLGDAVEAVWSDLPAQVAQSLAGLGLSKEDVLAVLGDSLIIGASSVSSGSPSLSGMPDVGARIVTPEVDRARTALSRIETLMYPLSLVVSAEGDELTLSTSQAYADELAGGTDLLSSSDRFTKAVPDHADASISYYLNLEALHSQLSQVDPQYSDFVGSLLSVGASISPDGDDSGTWGLRLVRS